MYEFPEHFKYCMYCPTCQCDLTTSRFRENEMTLYECRKCKEDLYTTRANIWVLNYKIVIYDVQLVIDDNVYELKGGYRENYTTIILYSDIKSDYFNVSYSKSVLFDSKFIPLEQNKISTLKHFIHKILKYSIYS